MQNEKKTKREEEDIKNGPKKKKKEGKKILTLLSYTSQHRPRIKSRGRETYR